MRKRHKLYRNLIAYSIAAIALLVLTAAPAAAHPDAWVTTKAKIALLADESIHGRGINVDTIDGRVSLYGKVDSAAEKAAAEKIVRGIEGVKNVNNMLTIAPRATASETRGDDEIEKAVVDALAIDHALIGSSVQVTSVDEGIVTLKGSTPTMTAHVRALQTTLGVPGVVAVRAKIESPDVLSEDEMLARAKPAPTHAPAATKPEATVGGTVQDMWITTATKLRLIGNDKTPALDINVDTENGEVTLFGIVPSEAAREAAAVEAKAVDGVTRVHNELQIVPTRIQEEVAAADGELKSEIEKRIEASPDLEDHEVEVAVSNGVARLTGTVDSSADRLAALTCARGVPGVRSAIDDLRIERAEDASSRGKTTPREASR
jgi:osmotically-inducible protein OsmY